MTAVDHDAPAHRFSILVDGHRGVLDYTLADGLMTITHTGVPSAIGGRGVAADLMAAALEVAHTAGWRVNPQCSYAAAYMRKHGSSTPRERGVQ